MIVEGSHGVPYFLDLAVDTWLEIPERRNRPPVADDFARTPREILDRFLSHLTHSEVESPEARWRIPVVGFFGRLTVRKGHLTQSEVETLKLLAVPRFWDTELFERLARGFQTGYPLTAYDHLRRFSFIDETTAPGTWTMHHLMRQSLQEHTARELVKRVHRFLFEHYREELEEIDVKGIADRQKTALAEAFYHGRAALPAQEFWQWFVKPTTQFNQAAQWRLLVPLYEQVVQDLETELGSEHPDVAECLNNLAMLLHAQGKYAEAEPIFRRALVITESVLGPEHSDVAEGLNNLASLLYAQGKYAEAEPLIRSALTIREKTLGPEHPRVAANMNNLAMLLQSMGRYAEAEPLQRRALTIWEKALGPEHPNVATSQANLAMLLQAMGRHTEAEPLYRRALAISEKVLGSEHTDVAASLGNVAAILETQDKYAEAEPLLRRALAINTTALGPEHPQLARNLNRLARLLFAQGRYAEAEPLFRQALAIGEKSLGSEHPDVATTLNNLAELLIARRGPH